ncbi:hypothetical protein GW17_00051161 [Ensete ventricosum]|uniref:Uncharacterized protein n=1 Tax=Ensete ventricosum TaxID=4639 RepID=A0A426Z8J5_ENSVE|nr:hypothetical protein B296_00024850 [Ensete ventricosum]RWV86895.1 hypothetical protein GW17_00051161 [Ensete ventricosum]
MALSGRLRSALPFFRNIVAVEPPALCVRSAADLTFVSPKLVTDAIAICGLKTFATQAKPTANVKVKVTPRYNFRMFLLYH